MKSAYLWGQLTCFPGGFPMSTGSNRDRQMIGGEASPFYFSAAHWRAIDGVVQAVKARRGLIAVTGPTGCGKTTTMRMIEEQFGDSVATVFVNYANLNFREFVNHLHTSLRVIAEVDGARNNAEALRDFLFLQSGREEISAVFIDEAQNLPVEVLRMLPKLSRLGTAENGVPVGAQFILFGDETLEQRLDDPETEAVGRATADRFRLRYFTRSEINPFLTRRLAPIARLSDEPITPEAVDRVALYTGGSPRLLGMICAHAMLFAAENPGRSITASMIDEAAEALMMEPKEDAFAREIEQEETGPHGSDAGADVPPDLSAAGEDDDDGYDGDDDLWEEGRRTPEPEQRSTRDRAMRWLRDHTPATAAPPANGRRSARNRRKVRTRTRGALRQTLRTAAIVLVSLGLGAALYVGQGHIRHAVATMGTAAGTAIDGARETAQDVGEAAQEAGDRLGASMEIEAEMPTRIASPVANVARGALDLVDGALDRVAEVSPKELRGAVDAASGALAEARSGIERHRADAPRIDELLSQASAHFDAERYTEPRGNNAYDAWRRVLDVAPDNAEALEGITRLKDVYVRLADAAREKQKWDQANRFFAKAVAVSKLRPAP